MLSRSINKISTVGQILKACVLGAYGVQSFRVFTNREDLLKELDNTNEYTWFGNSSASLSMGRLWIGVLFPHVGWGIHTTLRGLHPQTETSNTICQASFGMAEDWSKSYCKSLIYIHIKHKEMCAADRKLPLSCEECLLLIQYLPK